MAIIYGTTGADKKTGTTGNDTIYGWAKGGNANSTSGNDTLTSAAGNDQLFGGTGNDSLIGGLGIDSLNGGVGNDIYVIDSTSDKVTEAAASGTDTVRSSVTYTLGSNQENLTLQGTGAINGTGNSLNNTIIGNAANNSLKGESGNDTLSGGTGNDLLDGGLGYDFLDGGSGIDTVTYSFYSKGIIADLQSGVVSFPDNNGSTLTDTLSGVENVIGSGGRDQLIGDRGDNTLIGGDGDDFLEGGAGNDTLDGGTGFNYARYPFATAGVTVNLTIGTASGGGGNDILSNISGAIGSYDFNDTLIGGAGNEYLSGLDGDDRLFGEAGADFIDAGNGDDRLFGDAGNDELYGGNGNDTLTGGGDADNFSYTYSPTEGIDIITDFSVAEDTITVSANNGFGGGLTPGATITTDQFVLGSSARDVSNRFIYNGNTGALFFDEDGTGATGQLQLATLSTGLTMTNNDIFIT